MIDANTYFGYVYFRQQRDSSIQRGFLQKSIILISRFPYILLFNDVVKQIGTKYFIAHDTEKKFNFQIPFDTINEWKMASDHVLNVKLYEKLSYRVPLTQTVINVTKNQRFSRNEEGSLKERLSGRRYTFQDVNINSIFDNMEQLFRMFELCLLGESMLFYAPNPEMCANATMICASLISPLSFCGVIKPYFTVHNSEFKHFSSYGDTIGFKSQALIGFTNPFFLKSFDKWPHLICIGGEKQKSSSPFLKFNFFNVKPSMIQSSPDSRKKLLWEHQEMIWSKHDFIIKVDHSLEKKNLSLNDRELTESVNNENIRKYFEDLTRDFLDPLEKCFDDLWTKMTTFILRKEHHKVFKQEKFYNYVCVNGFKDKIFSASKSEIEEFYKKFIYSVNFQKWLNSKMKEAYHNDVVHTDIVSLIKNATEIGLIDLYLRLSTELKEEQSTHENPIIESKLEEFLTFIAKSLPESIRHSIVNNKN